MQHERGQQLKAIFTSTSSSHHVQIARNEQQHPTNSSQQQHITFRNAATNSHPSTIFSISKLFNGATTNRDGNGHRQLQQSINEQVHSNGQQLGSQQFKQHGCVNRTWATTAAAKIDGNNLPFKAFSQATSSIYQHQMKTIQNVTTNRRRPRKRLD
ncbi:hypothetical protein ACLOJK_022674 [Asimina triloba]